MDIFYNELRTKREADMEAVGLRCSNPCNMDAIREFITDYNLGAMGGYFLLLGKDECNKEWYVKLMEAKGKEFAKATCCGDTRIEELVTTHFLFGAYAAYNIMLA